MDGLLSLVPSASENSGIVQIHIEFEIWLETSHGLSPISMVPAGSRPRLPCMIARFPLVSEEGGRMPVITGFDADGTQVPAGVIT